MSLNSYSILIRKVSCISLGLTSSEKSLITSGIRDWFILSVVTGRVSVTPEVRVVTHWNIVHKTLAILLIGAGLAV